MTPAARTRAISTRTILVSCSTTLLASLTMSLATCGTAAAAEPPAWQSVQSFFTWNHGQLGVYPIFEVDVGRKSSAGAALFARDVGLAGNEVRLTLAAGLDRLSEIHLQDRLALFGGKGTVALRAHYRRRPDGLFYGVGSEPRAEDKTVFELREPEVAVALQGAPGQLFLWQVESLFRAPRFSGSHFSSTASIDERFGGAGQPALPAGWGGYQLLQVLTGLGADSRRGRGTGSGAELHADAGYALDPADSSLRLFRFGGQARALLDFSGRGHALSVAGLCRFVENQGTGELPFTELVELGGAEVMRGFLPGRLRGDSALVGSLGYEQPLGQWMIGRLFLDVGNVFPGRLDALEVKNLRGTYGLDLETTFSRDVAVGLLAGFGTSRFDADFDGSAELRMNLGISHRF